MNFSKIKEITIEIDNKQYHGFLYEINNSTSKSFYLEHPIEELDLSVRSYNCLRRANVMTFFDIKDKTLSDLIFVKNLGKKSLMEVYEKVYKEWNFIIPSGKNEEISNLAEHWRKTHFQHEIIEKELLRNE